MEETEAFHLKEAYVGYKIQFLQQMENKRNSYRMKWKRPKKLR